MPAIESKELYVLLEIASGLVLLRVKEWDTIAQEFGNVQTALLDKSKFGEVASVEAVYPFKDADEALGVCQSIVQGESNETLRQFLIQSLPKKKKKYSLGIADPALGKDLAQYNLPVFYDRNILEFTRLCRCHIKRLTKPFGSIDLSRFQVGLAHNFSRNKIAFDPNRQDKPVQNAVALIENLDKMINTFAMRVKEWYCWHFPELGKIVTDNVKFARSASTIQLKEQFEDTAENRRKLLDIVDSDETIVDEIMAARNISMGQEISEADMANIHRFATELVRLTEQRQDLTGYLKDKLAVVAPNLQVLIGDVLTAKLISHTGSLTNLAKAPASTVQILGAEKALFRALKTRGNTPKYGLLFQCPFISRAAAKNKGRISRYLANKCSLAARIDNFAPFPTDVFGTKMRDQVEARLVNLAEGVATRKNQDVMAEATGEYLKLLRKAEKRAAKKKAAAAAAMTD